MPEKPKRPIVRRVRKAGGHGGVYSLEVTLPAELCHAWNLAPGAWVAFWKGGRRWTLERADDRG